MEPRIKSPALTIPGARDALLAIHQIALGCGVPRGVLELVDIRVGQINGCSVCVDMHSRAFAKLGEPVAKLYSIAVWRETPYFSDAERAALALAEAATRLSDRTDAVPDDVWAEASKHYSEKALGAILLTIGLANFWNRLNVPTRQVTGEWIAQYI
jgi:AhpD family alkylhydroperoxidase